MVLFIGLVDYQIYMITYSPPAQPLPLWRLRHVFLIYDALSIMPLPHHTQMSTRLIGVASSLSTALSPPSDSSNGVNCGDLQQLSLGGQQKSYLSVSALSYIINVFLTTCTHSFLYSYPPLFIILDDIE